MALANRRTTLLLVGIAVVFTIVLIILCLTPPSRRPGHTGGNHDFHQQGRTNSTGPKDVKDDPPTSTENSTTTTARTTKTSTTEKSTTQLSTTVTSTTEPEFPDVSGSKTTTEHYDYSEEGSSDKTTAATTTTIQEPTTSTGSSFSDASPESTHANNQTSTSTERHVETPEDTDTTESSVLSSTQTESDNETTTGSDMLDESTTPSDATDTTVREINETTLDDTTTDDADSTTDEVIPSETTTKEVITDETTPEGAETTTEEGIFDDITTEATTVTEEDTTSTSTTEATTVTEEDTTSTSTTPETTTTPNEETECSHADCKKLAARMLDMMDHSASPCKDFYQYACGGVEDDPFLHPEDPKKDVNDRILRTLQSPSNGSIGVGEPAREYFKSCVAMPPVPSKDDLALLQELVSRHGLLDPRTLGEKGQNYSFIDEDAFDLQKMLADFIKYDFAPFFEVGIDVDKTDSTKFSVRLSLPLNGYDSGFSESIDTSYCKSLYEQTLQEALRESKDLDVTLEYKKLHACREKGLGHGAMITRLRQATKALNLTGHINNASLADKLLDDTVLNAEFFVGDIKGLWPDFHDLRHQLINKNYTEYRVVDLDSSDILINITNQVKWDELLQTIVGRPVDKVQVYHEHELMGVLKRMSEEKPENLRNMLLMLWASRLYTDLIAPATSSPNSPEYCASVTRYLAPDMAAVIYLQSFPKEELDHMKKKVDGVVNSVKNTVTAALNLTSGVSRELLDKLQHTFTKVGSAEQLHLLSESVSNSTQQLSLTGSYVAGSLDLLKRRRKNLYSLLGDETDSDTAIWNHFSVPYSVTATTLYGTNTILIPEGVMAPPLMYPALAALPNYLFYAGIGHLVAHEFLHAIDTTGIKFDAMSGAKLERPPFMDAQEKCIFKFINISYSIPAQKKLNLSFRLPARLHLNEMMADFGATRLAWLAYIHGETVKAGNPMDIVTDAPSRRRRRSVPTTDSQEKPLPWLGMTPYQLYLLRTAQTQCARTSDIDAVAIMEQEHLPARLRVNLAMYNEPLFAEAFECPVGSQMRATRPCPYVVSHIPGE